MRVDASAPGMVLALPVAKVAPPAPTSLMRESPVSTGSENQSLTAIGDAFNVSLAAGLLFSSFAWRRRTSGRGETAAAGSTNAARLTMAAPANAKRYGACMDFIH